MKAADLRIVFRRILLRQSDYRVDVSVSSIGVMYTPCMVMARSSAYTKLRVPGELVGRSGKC